MKTKIYLLMPLLLVSLLSSCNKSTQNNWWDHTDSLTEADVGKIEIIIVNNQPHRVRLIGVDHDTLSDGSGKKAHTTWEFVDLLSDQNGNSLATTWNTKDGVDSKNTSYITSNLRRVLDGGGDLKRTEIAWYEKASPVKSTTYTSSVFSMLPGGLQSVLKEVNKACALGDDYEVFDNYYQTKVFTLSAREMIKELVFAKNEGRTYQYYLDNTFKITAYIHKQVIHNKAYDPSIDVTEITDIASHPKNFAGYSSDLYEDSPFWLRSPDYNVEEPFNGATGITIDTGGSFKTFRPYVYNYALPIAPAFCI